MKQTNIYKRYSDEFYGAYYIEFLKIYVILLLQEDKTKKNDFIIVNYLIGFVENFIFYLIYSKMKVYTEKKN